MVEAPPAPRDEVEAVDLVASLRLKMAKNRWMVGALHPPYCCFNVDIQEHTFIMSVVHDCGQTSALPLSPPLEISLCCLSRLRPGNPSSEEVLPLDSRYH
jgi:hypothetical protein